MKMSEKREEVDAVGVTQRRSIHTQTGTDHGTSESDNQYGPIFNRLKWRDFGNATTLHGMRYTTEPNYNIVRRIIWAIIIVTCMSILIYVVVDSTTNYFNFNVSSIVTVKYVQDLVFPAVTICNYNLLRKSYAQTTLNVSDDVTNILNTGPGTYDFANKDDWNVTDSLIKGAHQKESMVIDCKWRSSINCSWENFTQVLTDFGVCYTFNNPEIETEALTVRQTGYDNGLYLRLNLEQYDYFYGLSKGAGFKVMLHKQKEYPFVKQLGFAVSPGFETLVTLKFTRLVNLKAPYVSRCVAEGNIDGFKYTVETCQAICEINFIIDTCGCKTIDLPAGPELANLNFCNYGELVNCVEPAKRLFLTDMKSQCECSVPCDREVFIPRISEVFWPAEHITKAIQKTFNSSETFLRKNIIDLVIFFEELNYEEIRQVAAYTFSDLLSDIGGYMGLMVGASIITFMEFLDFLVLGLIECCKKRNERRKRQKKISISESIM